NAQLGLHYKFTDDITVVGLISKDEESKRRCQQLAFECGQKSSLNSSRRGLTVPATFPGSKGSAVL
ncbi:hypothetical protein QTP86_023515, partial [Hemibagrus guttatus]